VNCKNCHVSVGQLADGTWKHQIEDGPDAHSFCKCYCLRCAPTGAVVRHAECCDGKDAEPERTYSGNMMDGIIGAVDSAERQSRLKRFIKPNLSGLTQADYDDFMDTL
jgi:hypothetical protein